MTAESVFLERGDVVSTVQQLLLEQAHVAADRGALISPGQSALTYRQLLERVQTLGAALTACWGERHDSIAVVMPNGAAMAVAVLASMSVGVCAPLNPACTEAEFEHFLADLKAQALIVQPETDSAAWAVAKRRGIPVIAFSEDLEINAGKSFASEPVRQEQVTQTDDIALRLYTSGTTAKPKRVPLTHANLIASARNIAATLRLTEHDRCLNVMPLYHIHGLVGALLSSLAAGSTIALPPPFETASFWLWFEELQPTWYTAVPTIHQAILAEAAKHSAIVRSHRLRFIRSSSAALPARVMAELEEQFKVPVIEAYGMTEAAHQMASNPLPPQARKAGSVGQAAGREVAIMDEAGNILSANETGEIVIRGANVTTGYESNPGVNAAAFAAGWFRTGDEGYRDEDGYLFITGRLKEMINKGGEKIAPLEIDEALLDHPEVAQAVAFAVAHPNLGEDLVAAVVLRADRQTTESALRLSLSGKLAEYKIPSRILIVDEIPKSSTGKWQRTRMAEAFATRLSPEGKALGSEVEAELGEIFKEVMGVKQVGATDNFFALGGDSVRAFQVIARVRAVLGVNLSIGSVFVKPTVAELAQEIQRMKASSAE